MSNAPRIYPLVHRLTIFGNGTGLCNFPKADNLARLDVEAAMRRHPDLPLVISDAPVVPRLLEDAFATETKARIKNGTPPLEHSFITRKFNNVWEETAKHFSSLHIPHALANEPRVRQLVDELVVVSELWHFPEENFDAYLK